MVPGLADKNTYVELELHEFTERLRKHPAGWRAVVLNLSQLRPDNRRTEQIRIAASIYESLVAHFEGRIFNLAQGDVVFLCKDANVATIENAANKVRCLFGDDPLANVGGDDDASPFYDWYELARDFQKFANFVQQIYTDEERRQVRLSTMAPPVARKPMDTAALHELAAMISRADLTNLLRRQPICAIVPGEKPRAIYRELYISIPDLRDSLMPKREITSDRWLFQHLTQILDSRVLWLLHHNDDSTLDHSFSLNLNVSTLLSKEFQVFDQNLKAGRRGKIIVELQKIDIFADLGAYIFARDYLHERGYRICLDGITPLTLPFIDRPRLGLDLVKLIWSPELGDPARQERAAQVRSGLERIGKQRIIVARCDNADAVRFGHENGIYLFQGNHIDQLLSATANAPSKSRVAAQA